MQNGRGFTLLEIVVIVVILAILGVAAAPRFLNLSHDARASTMISVGAAMESGLELLYTDTPRPNSFAAQARVLLSG
ncbi:prepilin-type N-terminal cleavage/methylation domain-containing protein, partial [Vibrio crassostreae]|uniref:prepilin-type N-terminal cleavage/methylation domain-containing protein n=1 Tax=Vibrio crassostreae TaxID=246167 RepID=UPI001B30E5B4